jgi:hypothetical protein
MTAPGEKIEMCYIEYGCKLQWNLRDLASIPPMKSQREIDLELFRINLGYYLIKSPECDIKWAVMIIRNTSISQNDLRKLLLELEDFGDRRRYRKLFNACRDAKFNSCAVRIF